MKNFYAFLIICLIAILFNSCSETGLEGPEGPAGPQGVAGNAGAVGAAGKDGSIIYSGTGTPPAALGANGDYYLDRATGNLYGPKIAAGWGTPITLMGIAGANGTNGANGANGTNGVNGTNGTNGSTTLSGNGIPSSSAGITGDYYLDKTNYQLYGPKTATGWGIPILLRGADGAQGPSGAAGKDGSIIYSGAGVPVATVGANGDYYLDKTTGNLYGPKTAGAWGTPIVLKGTNGINGANGTNGTDGTNGTNGTNGANGTNGTNGTNGSTTLSGNGTPGSTVGIAGDYYLDKTNYLLYGPKDNTGWGVPILLRGAAGAQGPTGPAGADGTVIYSGETVPDPNLGKNGDFYISRLPVMIYGPKTALFGWGDGTNLKGADGINGTNGTNGTNGANGNRILSGGSFPQNTLGNDGDFYIDLTSYVMYGPKTGGAWPFPGTPLKGADGNANVVSLETPDNVTFNWSGEGANFNTYALKKHGVSFNDTTSVFNIPAIHLTAVNKGIVMVYMRKTETPGVYSWKQLNYTDLSQNPNQNLIYSYSLRVDATTAKVRISFYNGFGSTFTAYPVDKVRIVIIPQSTTGVLSINPNNTPLLQTMQKLNLNDKDFKALK
ncbi:hypothetical protein J7E50_12055 [Pedobacter sp. ISL-68]|uniref:hypothetical protein n=1 Tax=unclassified Pedobacter TaxID=2628915 RepID=UPI001BE80729|nr:MULTISPECIES: hypothetical protein [unclassified Pedobacter]MBT2561568.1 hypothetical protein [Pedobacter sp. ISL-64]MBT2590957.1 hypothetical protein [Pedobacter sp. ISL-68]